LDCPKNGGGRIILLRIGKRGKEVGGSVKHTSQRATGRKRAEKGVIVRGGAWGKKRVGLSPNWGEVCRGVGPNWISIGRSRDKKRRKKGFEEGTEGDIRAINERTKNQSFTK